MFVIDTYTTDTKDVRRIENNAPDRGLQVRERSGRDLSSADAFKASLDLPFHELELTKLIGGGGFGQVCVHYATLHYTR